MGPEKISGPYSEGVLCEVLLMGGLDAEECCTL
jgi:hypothetical protein